MFSVLRFGASWAFGGLVVAMLSSIPVLADGPAVSGPNGKLSVEGGEYDDQGSVLALGSFAMPLGHALGLQADGAIGSIDDETMGGVGLHLFTRDPSKYLIGVYGSYHTWDSIDIWRTAAEFEFYLGRLSLSGLAGYEDVDVPETKNGLDVLNSDDGHFFGQAEVAFYPIDNLKLSAGYEYVAETSLGMAGAEYLFTAGDLPVSLFARGSFGDDDLSSITGGIKIYFGADPNKSLIDRHRTEDPDIYTPTFPKLAVAPNSTPPSTPGGGGLPQCQPEEVSPAGSCSCPPSDPFVQTLSDHDCDDLFGLGPGCFRCAAD